MIVLSVFNLLGSKIAASAGDGRQIASKFIEQVRAASLPPLVQIDFSRIDIATASFLREAVLGARRGLADETVAIVVSGANGQILDDLREVLLARDEVLPILKADGRIEILGELDPTLYRVLKLVDEFGPISAPELHREHPDEGVSGPSGWNNRLTSLQDMDLVIMSREGRSNKYSSLRRYICDGH